MFLQFFASGLCQNGEDVEGFDGFLLDDIKAEKDRAKKLVGCVRIPSLLSKYALISVGIKLLSQYYHSVINTV